MQNPKQFCLKCHEPVTKSPSLPRRLVVFNLLYGSRSLRYTTGPHAPKPVTKKLSYSQAKASGGDKNILWLTQPLPGEGTAEKYCQVLGKV